MNEINDMYYYENYFKKYEFIAGIDEVGRGSLCGPVVSAAVILPKNVEIPVKDSKKLSEKKRNEFFKIIEEKAISIGIGIIDNEIIDEINILNATKLSMIEAVENLKIKPDFLLIDALKIDIDISQFSIISGDNKSASIAAASIIAKVTRDKIMVEFDKKYPLYDFKKNKGYGVPFHKKALIEHGKCDIHRNTFISKIIKKQSDVLNE
ncbi:MAG: ribonuclease HII [Defluviitaleaceae bacterium]|nr:ribonuclease HII [Defluviitaleaceae bacterium]